MNFRKRQQKRHQAIKRSTDKLGLPPMPPPPGVPAAVAAELKLLEHQGEDGMPPLGCSRTSVDRLKDEVFQVTLKKLKMKLEDIKNMKDKLEDIREDRSCGSEGLAQFSREIPRMGEAVTKLRSGPITCQDTSTTRQMWHSSPQGQR